MMFGIGWGELLVIGGVGLIIIGPRDFPAVIQHVGTAVGTVKRFIDTYRTQFYEALEETTSHPVSPPSPSPTITDTYLSAQLDAQGSVESESHTPPTL
jgi:Tat protein translocase TatB subunit